MDVGGSTLNVRHSSCSTAHGSIIEATTDIDNGFTVGCFEAGFPRFSWVWTEAGSQITTSPQALQLGHVLLLQFLRAVKELRQFLCNSISFSIVTSIIAFIISQVLQGSLVKQELNSFLLVGHLHHLDEYGLAVVIHKVDIGTPSDKLLGHLEVATDQYVQQYGHLVLVHLVYGLLVLGNQDLEALFVEVFGCEHHWCQSLTVLDVNLLFIVNEVEHHLEQVFVLISNS